MIPRSSRRLVIRGFLAAAIFALASCAHRTQPPPPVFAVPIPTPAPSPTPTPTPAPPPKPAKPRVPPTAKAPAAPAPASTPEPRRESADPAAQISRLVQNGNLTGVESGRLIFAKPQSRKDPEPGLFEDAIILSRLRGNLRTLPANDEQFIAAVTVRRACACLRLSPAASPPAAARIIDAALRTPGVSGASVEISK